MKKVLTALTNPNLNCKLRKEKEIQVLSNDIIYQDGIFEALEKNKDADYIILSELLLGEYKIEELITKIKENNIFIKIIIILENKKIEMENILFSKGVYRIYYNNETEIKDIIELIKYDKEYNNNLEMKNEIKRLKEKIKEKELLNNENNIKINFLKKKFLNNNEIIKKIINLRKKNNIKFNNIEDKNGKVISIAGTGGVGKSIITVNLANSLINKNNKIVIIDFDILNNSLHTILGVNKYPEKIKRKIKNNNLIRNKIFVKELIIRINKNIDLISGINLLFDPKYKISSLKIKNIIYELKKKYDYIIIDNSSECFFDYIKNILNNSDYILFLLEANLLEIEKANNLLKIYIENWKININKIKLIINKYNNNSIDENIIKNIFSNYKLFGKIKFNYEYSNLINTNYKIKKSKILKDYERINKNIKYT